MFDPEKIPTIPAAVNAQVALAAATRGEVLYYCPVIVRRERAPAVVFVSGGVK